MTSRKIAPASKSDDNRRAADLARLLENMDREPPFDPAERLRIHKASKAAKGPHPGGTVRITMRSKKGDERPTVRRMYDVAEASRRRGR